MEMKSVILVKYECMFVNLLILENGPTVRTIARIPYLGQQLEQPTNHK